jgi:hypothetical protein
VNAAGRKIGEDVLIKEDGSDPGFPSLVWAGDAYHVLWCDAHAHNWVVHGASFGSHGERLGETAVLTRPEQDARLPSLFAVGKSLWATWMVHSNSGYLTDVVEVRFARLDAQTGRVDDEVLVATVHAGVNAALAVPDGDGAAIVWGEIHYDRNEVYFARVERVAALRPHERRDLH